MAEKTVTFISKTGKRTNVTFDTSRRSTVGSAGVVYKTKRVKTSDGRTMIEAKEESQVRAEYAKLKAEKEKEAITQEAAKVTTPTTQTIPSGGFSPLRKSFIDLRRDSLQKDVTGQVSKPPPKMISAVTSRSERYLMRAEVADIEEKTPKAFGYTALAFGSSLLEKDVKKAGKILFPEISGSTLKTRTGSTGFGVVTQEVAGLGVFKGGAKLFRGAKGVFGQKTIVGSLKGTGVTVSKTGSKQSLGTFTAQRTLVKPLQEAKKSNVLVQEVKTFSGYNPKIKADFGFKEKSAKTLLFGKGKGTSITEITTKDLAGKPVGKPVYAYSRSINIPASKRSLRVVKTYGDDIATKTYVGVTSRKQITETVQPARSITQEITKGIGVKQKVQFGETVAIVRGNKRVSYGGLENELKQVYRETNKITPKSKLVGGTPELPVTLKAGFKDVTKLPRYKFLGGVSFSSAITKSFDRKRIMSQSTGIKQIYESDRDLLPKQIIAPKTDLLRRQTPKTKLGGTYSLSTAQLSSNTGNVFTTPDYIKTTSKPLKGLAPIIPQIGGGGGFVGGVGGVGKKNKRSLGLPPSLTGLFTGKGVKTKKGVTYSGLGVRI